MSEDQFNKLFKHMRGMETRICATADALRRDLAGEINQLSDTVAKFSRHVEDRFDAVDQQFDARGQRFDQIMSMLDSDAKQREIDEHERLATGAQLDRHEEWIDTAAGKLDIRCGREV